MRADCKLAVVWLLCSAVAVCAQSSQPATQAMAIAPVEWPTAAMLSPEGKARLQAERVMMARELEGNASYDPDDVARVIKEMDAGALDTVQDNVQRFGKALAALRPKLAAGWELYSAGKSVEAAAALKPLMAEKVVLIKARRKHNTMSPYCYTLTKLLYAEGTALAGDVVEGVIAYQICYDKLPDNFTLSATARMRTAMIYEQTGRVHYAIPVYQELYDKCGALLTEQERSALRAKLSALRQADPYRLGARKSAELWKRLSAGDTGAETLAMQKELMQHLNDMIPGPEAEDRPFLEHSESIGEGANSGKLQAGAVGKLTLPGNEPPKVGSDDWGRLRPREKQQLIEAFNGAYPERYREMLSAYYKNLASGEVQQSAPQAGGR